LTINVIFFRAQVLACIVYCTNVNFVCTQRNLLPLEPIRIHNVSAMRN